MNSSQNDSWYDETKKLEHIFDDINKGSIATVEIESDTWILSRIIHGQRFSHDEFDYDETAFRNGCYDYEDFIKKISTSSKYRCLVLNTRSHGKIFIYPNEREYIKKSADPKIAKAQTVNQEKLKEKYSPPSSTGTHKQSALKSMRPHANKTTVQTTSGFHIEARLVNGDLTAVYTIPKLKQAFDRLQTEKLNISFEVNNQKFMLVQSDLIENIFLKALEKKQNIPLARIKYNPENTQSCAKAFLEAMLDPKLVIELVPASEENILYLAGGEFIEKWQNHLDLMVI